MAEGQKRHGVLCSDIARTLVFSGYDPIDADLIKLPNDRAVHKETVRLMDEIRHMEMSIFLITGMRMSGYQSLKDFLPHDRAITEHGGVIWTDAGIDNAWNAYLCEGIDAVHTYRRFLETVFSDTHVIQSNDRSTMFRLQADGDSGLSIDEVVKRLLKFSPENMDLQEQPINVNGTTYLVKVRKNVLLFAHHPDPPELSIDVIPERSGKLNALRYILGGMGIGWEKVAGFGDDDNDIGFISNSAVRLTFKTGSPGVLIAVDTGEAMYTYKTPYSSHRGTIDVLEKFLQYVVPIMKART